MKNYSDRKILLSLEEARGYLKESLDEHLENIERIKREHHKYLFTRQMRHLSARIRKYMAENNMTIDDIINQTNRFFDITNIAYQDLYNRLMKLGSVKEIFDVLELISNRYGPISLSWEERDKLRFASEYHEFTAANSYILHLGVENNARLLGYTDLKELNYWRLD